MKERDQRARARLVALLASEFQDQDAMREAARSVDRVDEENTAELQAIIERCGWPTRETVGEEAVSAAFLVLEHADHDPELQRRYLGVLEAAVRAGDLPGEALALLTDRILVNAGERQVYGTQAEIVDGVLRILPMEAPDSVDTRRAELGLPPLEEYRVALRRAYGLDDEPERAATGETAPAGPPRATATGPCDSPRERELDFWLGDWELRWPGGQGGAPEGRAGTGTNRVTRILDGCVIHERFHNDVTGLDGQSWSTFDPRTEEWKQTWVDDQGSYLTFSGGIDDGVMALYAPERATPEGRPFQMRMIWTDVSEDSLTWRYQRTVDGGAMWTDMWVISYERRRE